MSFRTGMLALILCANAGCGAVLGGAFKSESRWRTTHRLQEADAVVVCGGAPCDAIAVEWQMAVASPVGRLVGGLVDVGAGAALAAKNPARPLGATAGCALAAIGAWEAFGIVDNFPKGKLEQPTAIVWRGQTIPVSVADLQRQGVSGMSQLDLPISVERMISQHDDAAR
jgi:hypothetical protein